MFAYATQKYASTLGHMGEPVPVPEWGGFVLRRHTPFGGTDLAGAYPVTVIKEKTGISPAFERFQADGHVACTLVLDPLFAAGCGEMQYLFDMWRPFKTHFLYDRRIGARHMSKHHRYYVRQAGKSVDVREIRLMDHLEAWNKLYDTLVARHDIGENARFCSKAFETLSALDGVVAFGGFKDGELVACHIWVTGDRYAFSHLAASSEEGYRLGAAYALNGYALTYFDQIDVLNFGGVAGAADERTGGLARFKKGFSNRSAPSILCGKILNGDLYAEHCAKASAAPTSQYFPAYRYPVGQNLTKRQAAQ